MLLELLDGIFNEHLKGEIAKVMEAPHILTGNRRRRSLKLPARGHDNLTEVDSAALPTAKGTHKGRRFFVKFARKFTVNNSRTTRSDISGQECLTSFFSSY